MGRFLFIYFFTFVNCSSPHGGALAPIIGGKLAGKDSWPFIVSMNKYNRAKKKYVHNCGGSIINKYQIISAAHCFDRSKNPEDWIVIVGKNDIYMPKLHKGQKGRRRKAINSLENVVGPKEIIVHGGYRSVGFVNDIAIINLHQPLKLMEKPISSIKWALKPPSESEKCMVAGWGSTSRDTKNSKSYPYKLHEASVLMRNFAQCRVNYFLVMAKKFKVIEYSPAELKKAKDLWFYVQHRQNICAGNGKTD